MIGIRVDATSEYKHHTNVHELEESPLHTRTSRKLHIEGFGIAHRRGLIRLRSVHSALYAIILHAFLLAYQPHSLTVAGMVVFWIPVAA
jgi:hypothetical protein